MLSEVERFEEALAALIAAQSAYATFARQHCIDTVMKRNVDKNCAKMQRMVNELKTLLLTVK